MSNQQGEFYVALETLRASIEDKIDKVDIRQREAISKLEQKNETWQNEVRDEFTDVKTRLTKIETQTSTADKIGKGRLEKLSVWVAIVLLGFGMFKFYYKLDDKQAQQTISAVAAQSVAQATQKSK
jgi:uncharacterized protein YlxW (UPF0749 family)